MNQTIGIAEAKARLSEVIDRVESGETIVISRNGSPVAELRPIGRVSPEDAMKQIRSIAMRVAKRGQSSVAIRRCANTRYRARRASLLR